MIRKLVSVAFVVALMSATPFWSVAQTATPPVDTSEFGPPPTATAQLCSDEEITNGGTGIVREPEDMEAGVVALPTTPPSYLWLVEITIPPQSCSAFHAWPGPVVLFVQSGSIEYGVHSETEPPATVKMGHQDDATTGTTVPPDTLVPLHSGDWVTQDRAAWFTYRNPGRDSAVVSMAAYVTTIERRSGGKG
jgi:hypothetical protein